VIILDTNVVSEPLRSEPDGRVIEWLDAQAVETLYLTTITVAEVRFGIAILPEGKRKASLRERFEREVISQFEERLLTFDEPASGAYAVVRARARRGGLAVGGFDALIAGIAESRGFVVATRDTAPFEAAGVAVVNPFA